MSNNELAIRPVDDLKRILSAVSVQEQMRNALADKAELFTASIIDLYSGDSYLQKCKPALVVQEALKAATMNLPINKSLGFAYVVPFRVNGELIPQLQVGYKGLMQLAQRSGVYKTINAGSVFEGELVKIDKLTGELDLTGAKKSDTVIGYFAYLKTVNGFEKTVYASKDDVLAHAKKYSQSFSKPSSPWQKNTDEMGEKTLIRKLLSKYGQLSIEVSANISMSEPEPESHYDQDYGEVIDVEPTPVVMKESKRVEGPNF